MDITGFLGPIGGGLFGVIGSVATTIMKQRGRRQDAEDRREETELEIKRIQAGITVENTSGFWDVRKQQELTEAALAKNTHMWVNDIRALFRPALTVVCIYCAIYGAANDLPYIMHSFGTFAGTAVGWWFAERGLGDRRSK